MQKEKSKRKLVIAPNGLIFVPYGTISETLFHPIAGRTADGEYKKLKYSTVFYNQKGDPVLALISNKFGERFFVTCSMTPDGVFYMNGLDNTDEKYFGLPSGYLAQNEFAEKLDTLIRGEDEK